jgi:hypothetical protein
MLASGEAIVVRYHRVRLMTLSEQSSSRSPRFLFLLLAAYAAILWALLEKLPLWLDEILDLHGVRDFGLQELIRSIPTNSGGVPLGYLAQFATVHLFGYSSASGRLPSALFSLLAVAGIYRLVKPAGRMPALWAALIFALLPLQLRYAVEARPYLQALCVSVWTTVIFLKLVRRPQMASAVTYALLLVAGLYTQPYSLFVPAAHFVWVCLNQQLAGRRNLILIVGGSLLFAVLAFLPWSTFAAGAWKTSVRDYTFSFGPKSLLLVVREITGAGYIGTAVLAVLATYGWKAVSECSRLRLLWGLLIVVPLAGALVADAAYGYFIAIRQMIFVLTPLAVLAGIGADSLRQKIPWAGRGLAALLLLIFAVENSRYFFVKPHENWAAAADVLQSNVSRDPQSCIIFVPSGSGEMYGFFHHDVEARACPTNALPGSHQSISMAVSPYELSGEAGKMQARLARAGFKLRSSQDFHGPCVYSFSAPERK